VKSPVYNSYLVSKSQDVGNLLLCWQLLIWSRVANDTHKLDSVGLPAGESVTGHLSKSLCAAAFLSITVVALAGGCNHSRLTPEGATAVSDEVLQVSQALIGKRITIHGRFSLRGKWPGPYVWLDNEYVYIRGGTWGEPYSQWEGKLVEATGTLRFYHDPDAAANRGKAIPVARPPDHYYFEAETTQLRLTSP
jgi:hypothetical protein